MALFSKDPAPATVRTPARTDGLPQPGGTFIGPNITIDGRMTGSEPVTVEGTVRGKIDLSADLRIATKARVEATLHARNVIIEGKVTGDVSADERVELVATSSVEGNIKAPKIVVADGARFRGSVDMGSKVPRDADQTPAKAK